MKLLRGGKPILIVLFAAVLVGCGINHTANNEQAVAKQLFPADEVCTYPVNAPGKVFSNLGGGNWAPSDPQDLKSAFGCDGLNPLVQIFGDDRSSIEVEYSATGVKDGGSMITLDYRATGTGPIPNESTFRNAFANLLDVVSRHSLKTALPDLARRKLSNLKSYSKPGVYSAENFDAGAGFISLSRTASPDGHSVAVKAKFYPDRGFKLEQ